MARILAPAWAAVAGESAAAPDWARRLPPGEPRIAALLGIARGMEDRPFWVVGASRLVIQPTTGIQQGDANGDEDR
jgi:hypothetical protein